MAGQTKWPNEHMWRQAVEWKHGGLTYNEICGRLAQSENMKRFGLEDVPSVDTVRREVKLRLAGESLDSPKLKVLTIQAPRVDVFTDGISFAMYATLKAAADSGVEARDCWAWVDVLSSGQSFPLHWAGTPFTAEESTAAHISISPAGPARLDVVAALPPPGRTPVPFPDAIPIGEVAMFLRGSGEPAWNGEGCWLAQPVALYNPRPRLPSYLAPGKHRIRVRVGCGSAEMDRCDYVVASPTSWEGLKLKAV